MDASTKKKLHRIINKTKKDSSYNRRVIHKNVEFLETCFNKEFISEIIQLDVEEDKKLEFIRVFQQMLSRDWLDILISSLLYEKDGQSCLHLIVEKKMSTHFLLDYITLMLCVCTESRGISYETITKYLNLQSEPNNNNTFINMLMKDIVNDQNFDFVKDFSKLEKIFAFLNIHNYNFLLPDIDGNNLCDYINLINESSLSHIFYESNKDALAYTLKDDDDKNRKILDDIFDGFWRIDYEVSLLRGYLNSYRTFEDDNYSYDFSDFAHGFGNILKHIKPGHLYVDNLFKSVIINLKNKDPELLIKILEECIKNGYDINGYESLMNDILIYYDNQFALPIYKFLCKNGFNSYKSDMYECKQIEDKTLPYNFMILYHSQIFIESLKETITNNGLRYNFNFYDVNNQNEVNEFYNFLEKAKIMIETDEYYDLSEEVANIIIDEFNKSMLKQNKEVTCTDVLNAIKKIIIDGKEKQLRNIETYNQKVLEKNNYLL